MDRTENIIPEQVTILLPESAKDLVAWLKAHDPRFNGDAEAVVSFLLEKGAAAYYVEGLEVLGQVSADY